MKNITKVAILLGAYNAEYYIAEQLDSLLNQTYKDWTLYIRDDASTDNTKNIIQKYANENSNIVILEDLMGNLGCNGNYFHILELVESEYYMFCNADDYWLPNKVEISVKHLDELTQKFIDKAIIVHTDLALTDENLNIIEPSLWKFDNLIPEKFNNYNDIGICNTVAGATAIFNQKSKEVSLPPHPDAPFFDHWMALQVLKNKGIVFPVHTPSMYYRQIGTNLAAISLGDENTILFKLKNLGKVIDKNEKDAMMLKAVGWGGYVKYFYYKIRVFSILRFFNKV